MTEIAITGADREWATAIRAALIRGSDGMPSYPADIIPPIVAQIRHQARTEALEEAKTAVRHRMVAQEWPPQDGDQQIDEVLEALDALSRGGGE